MATPQQLVTTAKAQLKYARKMRLDFLYDEKKKKLLTKQLARKYSGRFNYRDVKSMLATLDSTIKSAKKDDLITNTDYIRLLRSYNRTILGTKYIQDIEKLIKTWTRLINAIKFEHDNNQQK